MFGLQADVASVRTAACLAKLAKLASTAGATVSPPPEVASFLDTAHSKLVMLQVQVSDLTLTCFLPDSHFANKFDAHADLVVVLVCLSSWLYTQRS